MTVGWLGIAFAVFDCYRVITSIFASAETAVQDAKGHTQPPYIGPGYIPLHVMGMTDELVSLQGIIVCVALSAICIYVLRGRLAGWVLGVSGVAIAVASFPLGSWTLLFLIAKYHLTEVR